MTNCLSRRVTVAILAATVMAVVAITAIISVRDPDRSSVATANLWITTPDQALLLARQPPVPLTFSNPAPDSVVVTVDPHRRFQSVDGFGASFTDSSAWLLATKLSGEQRRKVMSSLFDPVIGAGLSYLRQPMGSSDFALERYTYDDMPAGLNDPSLASFSIAADERYVLPLLRQAIRLNPRLKVMATPWSPPAWMRTGDSILRSDGGTLRPEYYEAYAWYFVKFVQAYAAAGVSVDAVTVQNEPVASPGPAPGMEMSPQEQAAFIAHLGPALRAAGLNTRLFALDHNWNQAPYAKSVLADPKAAQYVDGTAFHCYGGDPSMQGDIHDAFPSKSINVTECSGGEWSPDFGESLRWTVEQLLIGSLRNWASTVLMWNIALDDRHGPTNGVCTNCRGLVTVDAATGAVRYNPEYYALAHAARVVEPGAVRIETHASGTDIKDVAFQNADGSFGLVTLNTAPAPRTLSVRAGTRSLTTSLPAGAVASFRWNNENPTAAAPGENAYGTRPFGEPGTVQPGLVGRAGRAGRAGRGPRAGTSLAGARTRRPPGSSAGAPIPGRETQPAQQRLKIGYCSEMAGSRHSQFEIPYSV
jgi:glucosylceramidase